MIVDGLGPLRAFLVDGSLELTRTAIGVSGADRCNRDSSSTDIVSGIRFYVYDGGIGFVFVESGEIEL